MKYYTVKEIADLLNVSPQAVYKKIKKTINQDSTLNNQLNQEFKMKKGNKTLYSSEFVEFLCEIDNQPIDNQLNTLNNQLNQDSIQVIEILQKQIEEKDKQIQNLQELVKNSQVLLLHEQQKVKQLEQKITNEQQTDNKKEQTKDEQRKKRGLFARLFSKD